MLAAERCLASFTRLWPGMRLHIAKRHNDIHWKVWFAHLVTGNYRSKKFLDQLNKFYIGNWPGVVSDNERLVSRLHSVLACHLEETTALFIWENFSMQPEPKYTYNAEKTDTHIWLYVSKTHYKTIFKHWCTQYLSLIRTTCNIANEMRYKSVFTHQKNENFYYLTISPKHF